MVEFCDTRRDRAGEIEGGRGSAGALVDLPAVVPVPVAEAAGGQGDGGMLFRSGGILIPAETTQSTTTERVQWNSSLMDAGGL
jgi:hypothetical protein